LMKGSDLLVKCLENESVERVFGIPGEENLDLLDSLIDSGIEFVLTRHESGAAFMAGMVGRLTGRPGVCLTTLGPGASNMVIGVGEAYLGYYPMVAMSGQLRTECQREPRKQYLDLTAMFRPITKASMTVPSANRIPELVRKAFGLAAQERPGPVFLELPEDVMKERWDSKPATTKWPEMGGPDGAATATAREIIATSCRPIVLAGHGVVRSRASTELVRFVESWNIPAAMTWLGTGSVPFGHPLSLGTVGLRRTDLMRVAFEEADLVILVGFDLMEFEPQYWNFGAKKRIVYIGMAPCETPPGLRPAVQLLGDITKSLRAVSEGASVRENWTTELKAQLVGMMDAVPEQDGGVKPQAIVRAIRNSLGQEDIAVSDVGAHLIWMAQRYPVYKENTLLMSNGLIPMGVGIPWAIAAKLTFPQRKVVASVGDGSFLMTSMELETAKRMNTPFVTVVWNDACLDLIRIKQEKAFGRESGTRFTNPDIVKYAESMGAEGHRVSTAEELQEKIVRCLRDDNLAVIDVPIDTAENSKLRPN
jgi:acetolactate synthase-1/2/3 large subunit